MKKTVLIRILAVLTALVTILPGFATGFAESAEPVTLKWITVGDKPETQAYEDVWAELNKMLLRDFNAQVEIEYLGWTDPAGQLALRYASGSSDFDFTFMGTYYQYTSLANKNAFAELTDEMMATYMPGTWSQISKDFINQARVNGKLYMIPFNSPRYNTCPVAIRGDLREKYNIAPLTSLEDFTTYLKTVAANEPTMQAFAPGLFNFYQNAVGTEWQDLAGATEVGVVYEIGADTNNIFSYYFTDEYIAYAKWARELAEAGCWPEDAISSAQVDDDMFDAGALASFADTLTTIEMRGINAVSAGHEDWKVELYEFQPKTKKAVSSCLGNGTSFNPKSEHLELAMQVVDKFYSDKEYNELIMLGFEGKNWSDAGEGLYRDLDSTLPETEQYKGSWYATWCWVNQAVERQEDVRYGAYPEIVAQYADAMVVSKLDGFSFENSGVATETATLTDVVKMYADPIAYGMFEDPEAAVEDFRNALKTAGFDAYMAAVQTQVDDFLATH